MHSSRPHCEVLLLLAAPLLLAGCGASPQPQRRLESITLSPAAADAQSYHGQVQFVATGHYNDSPLSVTPLSAGWGTCYQDAPTTQISVTSNGLASCSKGATGTFTVWANDPPIPNGPVCNAMTACGGGCFIAGTAELTCP